MTIRVALFCSPPLERRLRFRLRSHSTAVELLDGQLVDADLTTADVVMLEPRYVAEMNPSLGMHVLTAVTPTRVLAYTRMDPRSIRATLDLGKVGITHVLMVDFDDTPGNIAAMIESIPADHLIEQVVAHIRRNLERLPSPLASVIVDALRRPERYASAAAICAGATISRRSCDRWFSHSGMASLQCLLVAARVVRSFGALKSKAHKAAAVAAVVGLSPRQLADDVRRVTGLSIAETRRLSEQRFIQLVVAYICRKRQVDRSRRSDA